jgi:predicted nucleotidyltransferase
MTSATGAAIQAAIRDALRGVSVAGCFVYGSVARGCSTAASDLDTFVLLPRDLPQHSRDRLRTLFVELQRGLGLPPDLTYPVELFTIDTAWRALIHIERCLDGGTFGDLAKDGDEREVLRALSGAQLVVVHSEALAELTAEAHRINELVTGEARA